MKTSLSLTVVPLVAAACSSGGQRSMDLSVARPSETLAPSALELIGAWIRSSTDRRAAGS